MYLVPLDIYNQVKDKVSTEDDIEMTSLNRDLDQDDFFKETIKNEMKTNFQLPPLKKTPSNTNQPTTTTNQAQASSTNQQLPPPSHNNSLNNSSVNTTIATSGVTPSSGAKRKMLTPKPQYKCDTCGKVYKKRAYFLKHLCPNVTMRNSSLDETYEEQEDKPTHHLPALRASSRNVPDKSYIKFFE